MKTILVPEPVYLELPESFQQGQNKENQHWVYFNKRKAIQKARKLANDQQKKVAELMNLLKDFQWFFILLFLSLHSFPFPFQF